MLLPLIAAMATLALNSGLWVRRLLIGGSPVQGRYPQGLLEVIPTAVPSQVSSTPAASAALGFQWPLIKNYLISNSGRLGVPLGKRYSDIVLQTCVNESFDE